MRNRTLFTLSLPLWLLGILFAPNLSEAGSPLGQAVAILWITALGIWIGGAFFLVGPVFRHYPSAGIWVGLFLVITLPRCLFSLSPATSLGFWATTVAAIVTCAGLWTFIDERDMRNSLAIFAGIGLATLSFLVGFSFEIDFSSLVERQGRLDLLRNPNSMGMILMGLLIGALTIKNKIYRSVLIFFGFGMLLLTLSRSALVGTMLAYGVMTVFTWKSWHPYYRFVFKLAMAMVFLVALFYGVEIWEGLELIFKFNDSKAGWGKFTHRSEAWLETINLWEKSPLLGVGYRMHEPYITTLSSSHNGYLGLLAETGILGTIPMIMFLITCGWHTFKAARRGNYMAQIGLSIIVGVAFISFFERTLINFGNPTSVIQLSMLLCPWPDTTLPDIAATRMNSRV